MYVCTCVGRVNICRRSGTKQMHREIKLKSFWTRSAEVEGGRVGEVEVLPRTPAYFSSACDVGA